MNVLGHSKWCDRKGKLANMSGNYCSTCGRVVMLKTGKTDEEKRLAKQLAGAVELAEAVKAVMGTLNFYIGPSARTAVSRESLELYRRIERALADFGGR